MMKATVTLEFTMPFEETTQFYQDLCQFLEQKKNVQVAQLEGGVIFE